MKSNLWKLTFAAAFCAISLLANGAPLQRADIAAEPAWLVHIDFDGLRPTTIGQHILSELDKPENKAKLAALESIFSFNPRTQLHAATLYGTSSKPQDGVLIVYADFDPERLEILAKAAKDAQSVEHGKHTIRSWVDDNKKKEKAKQDGPARTYATIQGKRVIFGQREEAVAAALDVLDGTSPNLATTKEFADLGAAGDTHIVEGAARKLDMSSSDPNASFLKFSKTAQLALGEIDGQFHGKLTLLADDEKVAGHIFSIAQGLLALMKLDTSKPETINVANALAVKQDGARVVANLDLPAKEVVEMMKADAARKAHEKKKKHSED
jgi:hypothetical protein